MLKIEKYRNRKLLDLARHAPCMFCGADDGTIVACHSNQLRDGRGTGIKAPDYRIAFGCSKCHYELDNGNEWTREEKIEAWEEAHRATIGWLFDNGYLEVK